MYEGKKVMLTNMRHKTCSWRWACHMGSLSLELMKILEMIFNNLALDLFASRECVWLL
jgi:hypothetical protein